MVMIINTKHTHTQRERERERERERKHRVGAGWVGEGDELSIHEIKL